MDGQSFEEIEAMGLEGWLSGIKDDLRAKTYRPERGAAGDGPKAQRRWPAPD